MMRADVWETREYDFIVLASKPQPQTVEVDAATMDWLDCNWGFSLEDLTDADKEAEN